MPLDLSSFDGRFSQLSIAEERANELAEFECENPSVARVEHLEKGVYFFESTDPVDGQVMILSAGLHGDELAGIEILDFLRAGIMSGKINLRRNVVFIDGNLKAMEQAWLRHQKGVEMKARYFDGDKSFGGLVANANRQWLADLLPQLADNGSYASRRQWEIWQALSDIIKGGSDTQQVTHVHEHLDLHQSFSVPTVKAVRGEHEDESEYTYAMIYAQAQALEGRQIRALDQFRQRYSQVFAGGVLTPFDQAETFAGLTAREFRADSITAELGTIGHPDKITYADKMKEVLSLRLQGLEDESELLPLDVWRQVENLIRDPGVEDFGFYKASLLFKGSSRHDHEKTLGDCEDNLSAEWVRQTRTTPPVDFIPLNQPLVIPRANQGFRLIHSGSSLLFANDQVEVGDRAGSVIERFED